MERCLIAMAVWFAAGTALAQSPVTLYCPVDMPVGNIKSVSTTQLEIDGNIRNTGRFLEARA